MVDNDELLKKYWSDLPLKEVLRASETYIVFINNANKFDWKIKDECFEQEGTDKRSYKKLLSKFSELEIEEETLNNENQIFRFRQLLANIFVNIVEADYDSAEIAIKNAKEFVVQRNLETTRMLSLISILGSSVFVLIFALFFSYFEITGIFEIVCKSLFSVVGIAICSFFSTRKKMCLLKLVKRK